MRCASCKHFEGMSQGKCFAQYRGLREPLTEDGCLQWEYGGPEVTWEPRLNGQAAYVRGLEVRVHSTSRRTSWAVYDMDLETLACGLVRHGDIEGAKRAALSAACELERTMREAKE